MNRIFFPICYKLEPGGCQQPLMKFGPGLKDHSRAYVSPPAAFKWGIGPVYLTPLGEGS